MSANSSFRVLEAEGSLRQEWLALLDSWPDREVFAHPDYLSLHAQAGQKPICLVYESSEGRVLYPLIIRDLRATPFWESSNEALFDAAGPPYGYGGPFVQGTAGGDTRTLLEGFFGRYHEWARSQGVVCEYLTFSPHEQDTPGYPGAMVVRSQCVVRSLDLQPEQMLRDYKETVARQVRSAGRAGVSVEVDLTGDRASEFLSVYAETMRRREADASYALNFEFLDRLNRSLRGQYAYFYALLGGKIVSTELVLLSAGSSFFFRGGTLAEAFPAKPNHLLKHCIILWSREQGKRSYVLGGGNDSDDSLYRYKLSFAPHGARPLRVGKWIFDDDQYQRLLAARLAYECARGMEWRPRAGFFPAYRAPAEVMR